MNFIKQGADVSHKKFGKGKIISVEGDFPSTKATINFPAIGENKTLLLKFAKLMPA